MKNCGECRILLDAVLTLTAWFPWVITFVATVLMGILAALFARRNLAKRTSLPAEEFPVWDHADSVKSLNQVFRITLKQGEAAIEWYQDNIRAKRAGSRILRSLAIMLASIGALLPLVIAAVERLNGRVDAQWGYIAFATAAACIAADTFLAYLQDGFVT